MDESSYQLWNAGWNYLSIVKLRFHPILYWVFEISMLGLKLNHASKRGLWDYWPHIDVYWNCFLDQWHRFHINDLSSFRVGNIFFMHCWQRLVQTGHAATNIISSYVSLTQFGLVSGICCLKTNLSPTVTYVYSKKFQDDTISINQVKRTLLWSAVLRLIPWIPKV